MRFTTHLIKLLSKPNTTIGTARKKYTYLNAPQREILDNCLGDLLYPAHKPACDDIRLDPFMNVISDPITVVTGFTNLAVKLCECDITNENKYVSACNRLIYYLNRGYSIAPFRDCSLSIDKDETPILGLLSIVEDELDKIVAFTMDNNIRLRDPYRKPIQATHPIISSANLVLSQITHFRDTNPCIRFTSELNSRINCLRRTKRDLEYPDILIR